MSTEKLKINQEIRRPGINKLILEIRKAHPEWKKERVTTEAKSRYIKAQKEKGEL